MHERSQRTGIECGTALGPAMAGKPTQYLRNEPSIVNLCEYVLAKVVELVEERGGRSSSGVGGGYV